MKIGLMTAPSWAPVPRAMLLLIAVQLVLVLPFALQEPSATDGASLALFTHSSLCMVLHCVWEMARLRASNQRLHAMCAPSAAWRSSAAAYLNSVTVVWIIFSAALTLRFARPTSGMHWITGGAVLSLLCCLASLHRYGITRRGRPLAALLAAYGAGAVLAAFFVAHFTPGPHALMVWLDQLPHVVHWAMLLSWPAAALLLRGRWQAQQPASTAPDQIQSATTEPSHDSWRERLKSQLHRYSLVSKTQGKTAFAPALRASYLLLVPLTALLWLRSSWGSPFAQAEHLLPMVIVMAVSSDNLIMRDLHWRRLLAPGGGSTSSIALNIFLSSLASYLALTLLLGLCMLGLLCLAGRLSIDQALDQLLLRTLIVPELAFCLACAVAFKSVGRWTPGSAGIAAALLSLPLLHQAFHYPDRIAYIDGNVTYCAVLLLLTAVVLLFARKTWTLQKLAPYWQGS